MRGHPIAKKARAAVREARNGALDHDPAWVATVQERLAAWYEDHPDLPWRRTGDAYRILVSEMMLVQTTVTAVIPYFERFLSRFPDVGSLAAADRRTS